MKKFFLVMIALVAMSGCEKNKEEKAQIAIKKYLHQTLYAPDSYESVSFDRLYPLKDNSGQYEMMHTYRAKNSQGGIVTTSNVFQFDSTCVQALCCFIGEHDQKSDMNVVN